MPGRPLPGRAPAQPTMQGQAAATDKAIAQLDRRINRPRAAREPVWVQPDAPGHAVGRLWFDTDSTADAP